MILGISGYANTGKDEVGRILVERFGYHRRSVGDVVWQVLVEQNPWVRGEYDLGLDDRPSSALSDWLAAGHSYEWLKENTTVRELMQRLGAGMRHTLGEQVLIDAVLQNCPERMVMTSCRYRNEARAILRAGGKIVRVERPGFGPESDHPTEVDMDGWVFNWTINNDGTLEDLADEVSVMCSRYGISPFGELRSVPESTP